jgi:type IV pilus assembly protein PilW
MISITIGLVVIGAILTVYLSTSSTSRQNSAVTRMSEDAAIAMTLIGNYMRVGGYSPPLILVSPGSANVNGIQVSVTDRNFTGIAIRGCDNGFTNVAAAFDSLACSNTTAVGQSAVALRFEGDLDSTLPDGTATNPTDCVANAVTANTPSALDASQSYKLIESRLFVATSANGTPEFYCAGNGGVAPFTRRPLIQYVESLFITYGVADNAEEKNVTRYMTQTQLDGTAGTVASKWGRVVSLKMCMVLRSQNSLQDGGGNYIDCAGNSVASGGGFARRAFTSTFTLRNRGDFASS